MTEVEWLAATDPVPMISFIRNRSTERQQRLAACACYRWEWAEDRQFEWVIDCAERYADGECGNAEARATFVKAMDSANPGVVVQGLEDPSAALRSLIELDILKRKVWTALCVNPIPSAMAALAPEEPKRGFLGAIRKVIGNWLSGNEAVERQEPKPSEWCDFLRDVFGNPFRAITLAPVYRTPTVISLARAAYNERQLPSGEMDPRLLAVLADALEEAGAPGELVAHLRSPGPHVRGCHIVDLCLGLS